MQTLVQPGGRLLRWLPSCLEGGGGRRASITKVGSTSHRGRRRPLRIRRLRWTLPHLGALVEPSLGNLARGRQPGCGEARPCRRGYPCGGCTLQGLYHFSTLALYKQKNKRNWHYKILLMMFIIVVGSFSCTKMKQSFICIWPNMSEPLLKKNWNAAPMFTKLLAV